MLDTPLAVSMSDAPLFCPFCRECFEGEAQCPEHELPLVPFERLPKMRRVVGDDERLSAWDLRFGRGIVGLAAATILLGFAAPLVTSTIDAPLTVDGFRMAVGVAPNLWVVPCVALALVVILGRRRTLVEMRSMRLAVPLLAGLVASSLAYSLWRVHHAAALLAMRIGRPVTIEVRWGTWVLGAAVVLGCVGGARLGVTRAADGSVDPVGDGDSPEARRVPSDRERDPRWH